MIFCSSNTRNHRLRLSEILMNPLIARLRRQRAKQRGRHKRQRGQQQRETGLEKKIREEEESGGHQSAPVR